jgi:hypothetical protein
MQVAISVQQLIEMKKNAVKRVVNCKENNLCVACDQSLDGERRVVRGCHYRCYAATMRAIKDGSFQESDRVANGKLLAKKKVGGRPTNPVTIEANDQ